MVAGISALLGDAPFAGRSPSDCRVDADDTAAPPPAPVRPNPAGGTAAAPADAGKPASFWVEQLGTPSGAAAARDALRRMGVTAGPALAKALDTPSVGIRSTAASLLGTGAWDATPWDAALARATFDADAGVRAAAASALAKTHGTARPSLLALQEVLNRPASPRTDVALALVPRLGSEAAPLLDALAPLLDPPTPDARRAAAARAIGSIGPAARAMLPTLIGLSREPQEVVRAAALEALSRVAPASDRTLGAVLAGLEDERAGVRTAAQAAWVRCAQASEPAYETVLDDLDSEETAERTRAAAALLALGPPRAAATPLLARALTDPIRDVRVAAVTVLARAPGGLAPYAPALLDASTEDEPSPGLVDGVSFLADPLLAVVRVGDPVRRRKAIAALRLLPREPLTARARAIADAVAPVLRDESETRDARENAARLLTRVGVASPELRASVTPWLVDWAARDGRARGVDAIWETTLCEKDGGPYGLALWRGVLFDGRTPLDLRVRMVSYLSQVVPPDRDAAVRLLVDLLGDPTAAVGDAAQHTLTLMPDGGTVLLDALESADETARYRGVSALQIAGLRKDDLAHLAKRLDDGSRRVGVKAARQLLARTGPEGEEAIQAAEARIAFRLAEGLESADVDERRECAAGFLRLGPAAASALPALREAKFDPDPRVADGAKAALRRIELLTGGR